MGDAGKPTARKTSNGPQVGPYVFGRTLGTGSTGKVKVARHVETQEVVAVKIVRKDFLDRKPSLKRKLQREITVMKLCDHPNVLKLLDVFEIETHLFLVIEYVDGCELFEYLVKQGSLPPSEALKFFQQIVCALEYCHKRLICHRDLKPENILLDRELNLKVVDFGMTSLNPPGSFLETSCGSPHYAAPEVVSGDLYNGLEADVWSTGVILYAMLTGRLPFDDDNIQKLLNKVQRGVYHIPSDMPSECKNLVRAMLQVDPAKRITIEGIKNDPWFKSQEPRNSPKDDFDALGDPITEPDMAVVQALVDLGWGQAQKITTDLAAEGANLEKVFYNQLSRHPMCRKQAGDNGGAPSLVPQKPKEKPTGSERWLPPEWRAPYEKEKAKEEEKRDKAESNGNVAQLSQKVADTTVSNSGDDASRLPAHVVAALAGMKDGSSTVSAPIPRSESQLVRQSELVKREAGGTDVDAVVSPGDGKSWFNGFKSVFGNHSAGSTQK